MKTQKHLGFKLDEKLNFKEHLRDKFTMVNKGIGMLKKLSNYLPRHSLVTLYKAFIRPNLDYADIIYDEPNNMNICNKIRSLQYNAALAITGTIRGSSKEQLYQERGFEYFSSRRWLRKLCKCLTNELIKIDSCILILNEKSFTKLLLKKSKV